MTSGWGWPGNSRRPHFFVDGRSLCGKWAFFGIVSDDTGDAGAEDCAACAKKMVVRRKSATPPTTEAPAKETP